jgi:hypothetical protein
MQHVWVSFTMLMLFVINASDLGANPDLPTNLERWGTVIIDAILYLYFAVMINLRLIKRRSNKRMQQELACKGIISTPTGPLVRILLINWLMLGFVSLTKTW